MQKINRVGEQRINNYGSLMTIVEYDNCDNITVEYEDGYKVKTTYGNFKKGEMKSPYDKTIFNIGFLGEGKYTSRNGNEKTIQYKYWYCMMGRCYNDKLMKKQPTYEDKYVCEEWHNYQTFAKWFDENYYECNDGFVMDLDKDIINKGNKVYSPDNCVFVSHRINNLFTKSNSKRGELPIGVSFYNKLNKYRASCSVYSKIDEKNKTKHLGYFDTPEEAFYKYKEFKENYIKEVAEEYKDLIPINLYEAMINYVVEIDD